MTQNHPGADSRADRTVPLWMRKSTLWVVLILSAGLFALIAYYLLPLWWARLVGVWVGASSAALTGLLIGFLPITIGLSALRGALAMSSADGVDGRRGKARHILWLALGVVAGLGLVVLLLTVSIAIGFTAPLSQARELWQESTPGVLVFSLVGGLLAVIVVLGIYALRLRLQGRRAQKLAATLPQQPIAEPEPAVADPGSAASEIEPPVGDPEPATGESEPDEPTVSS